MKDLSKTQRGFTLIELMVTISIGAVLMAIAIPSFTEFRRNSQLTTTTNTLVNAINTARSEAMKRGTNAMVVPVNNGSAWTSGWTVFVYNIDSTRSPAFAFDPALDKVVLDQPATAGIISITGTNTADDPKPFIMFNASGYSRDRIGGFGATTLSISRNDVSGADIFKQTRNIKIAMTGRVKVCTPKSASDDDC
jgi:type IV fimbrial biogenesis protein FimT